MPSQFFINANISKPPIGPCIINPAVASFVRTGDGNTPAVFQLAGSNPDGCTQVPVAANLLFNRTAQVGIDALGDNIHRPANRWQSKFGCSESPLNLDIPGNCVKSEPVRPVDPSVLHIIYRYSIDHHGEVSLAEPANVDAGIPVAATLLGSINTGSFIQNHRNIAAGKFFLELHRPNC